MPGSKVKELAEASLEWIENKRVQDLKEDTDRYLEEKQKLKELGWWYRFINGTSEKDINSPGSSLSFQMQHYHYDNMEIILKQLLKACKFADEIYVSIHDLSVL